MSRPDPDHPPPAARPSKKPRAAPVYTQRAVDDFEEVVHVPDPDHGGAGDGGAVPVEDLDVPEPYVVGAIDWSKYEEDPNDPVKDPTFCLKCHYATCARAAASTGNQKWKRMMDYERENRTEVHPFVYVREMQKLYNEGVRYHLTDNNGELLPKEQNPGPWPAQQIWDHPLTHVLDPELALLENARAYQALMRAMMNQALVVNKAGVVTASDLKYVKQFGDTEKICRPLLNQLASRKRPAAGGSS